LYHPLQALALLGQLPQRRLRCMFLFMRLLQRVEAASIAVVNALNAGLIVLGKPRYSLQSIA